jgi:hypothetical protein
MRSDSYLTALRAHRHIARNSWSDNLQFRQTWIRALRPIAGIQERALYRLANFLRPGSGR